MQNLHYWYENNDNNNIIIVIIIIASNKFKMMYDIIMHSHILYNFFRIGSNDLKFFLKC